MGTPKKGTPNFGKLPHDLVRLSVSRLHCGVWGLGSGRQIWDSQCKLWQLLKDLAYAQGDHEDSIHMGVTV